MVAAVSNIAAASAAASVTSSGSGDMTIQSQIDALERQLQVLEKDLFKTQDAQTQKVLSQKILLIEEQIIALENTTAERKLISGSVEGAKSTSTLGHKGTTATQGTRINTLT